MKLSKEDIEKKLQSLEAKQQKLTEAVKTLPTKEIVEKDDKKQLVNPKMNAQKSSRKVRKKIVHLKAQLKKLAS